MRMARVSITVPDDLLAEARARGWNISRMTTQALRGELERQHTIEALDRYLAQLDDELGPISKHELDEAEAWAERVLAAQPVEKRSRRLPA
jgi:post-segregation antitoxin (ccd killing protein)